MGVGMMIRFWEVLLTTMLDVAPILILILFFQFVVLRKPIPQWRRVILGGVYVVIGLALFLMGLEKALFPLGNLMAEQLADPEFIGFSPGSALDWTDYYWIYLFAAMIGFATAIAEPSLIAVAFKASEASAGTISQWGLRITVAIGVGIALTIGSFRIVSGIPLYYFIIGGYVIVIIQTIFAPRELIALAYDSGGVATSTVTVPIVVALGLGLSNAVPGRNPMVDGFGMIAIACMFPIISVLGYAQYKEWLYKKQKK
jgi:hypothetical protein